MTIPENAQKPVFEYAWKFNVKGEEKVFVTHGDYPTVDGDFIDVETTEIQKGYEPPVDDFTIEQNGEDFAASLLQEPKLMMIIAYDLRKSKYKAYPKLAKVITQAKNKGYKVIGMSASGPDQTNTLVKDYSLDAPFYFTDETTLKTIVRSNPGVLLLEQGTIQQKVHYNDLNDLNFD
jgi:FMN phosphatase YigB (HAD superfamily)